MAELKDFVELGMVGFTDKGNYEGGTTYVKNDLVHSDNKIWKCLQDNTTGQDPEEGEYWTVWIDTPNDLSNLNVTDTNGILSQGQPTEPPATVTAQELLDGVGAPAFEDSGEVEEISAFDKFLETVKSGMKFIDFFKNLKAGLKFVLHTGQLVNNGLCNEPGKYPLDAAYGKILLDMITENQTAISALNADWFPVSLKGFGGDVDTLENGIVIIAWGSESINKLPKKEDQTGFLFTLLRPDKSYGFRLYKRIDEAPDIIYYQAKTHNDGWRPWLKFTTSGV